MNGGIIVNSIELVIGNEAGLHARPAAVFVKEANKFKSEIIISNGDREANAKSLLGILSLAVSKGAKIEVKAEGSDSREALEVLKNLVDNNFGE